MSTLWLASALLLPWAAGTLCVLRAWPQGQPGRVPAALGYGYFLGLLATVGILRLLEYFTGAWQFSATMAVIATVALLAFWWQRHEFAQPRQQLRDMRTRAVTGWRVAPWPIRLIGALLVALITLRLGGALLETLWRPVWAWDAWTFWSYAARGSFELGHVLEVTWRTPWLLSEETTYLTDLRHPMTIPMVQIWAALALGTWHESLVFAPWWCAGVAVLLAIYGQSRSAAAAALPALGAVYVLISLPIVSTHLALAGYADLWVGCLLGLASMCLALWLRNGWRSHLLLALLLCGLVATIKQTSLVYAVLIPLAAMIAWLPMVATAAILMSTMGIIAMLALTVGVDVNFWGLGKVIINAESVFLPMVGELGYYPVWRGVAQRLLDDASWHLLWFAAVPLTLAGCLLGRRRIEHRAMLIVLLASLAILLVAFTASRHASVVVAGTGINRHILTMVPTMVFWFALIATDLAGRPSPRLRDASREPHHLQARVSAT